MERAARHDDRRAPTDTRSAIPSPPAVSPLQAQVLKLQHTAGNAAVAKLARTRKLARESDWARDAELALKDLWKGMLPHNKKRHEPTTGRGYFDVEYDGRFLWINVKVRFNFVDGAAAAYPDATAAELAWTAAEKDKYKRDWVDGVHSVWKPGLFRFYCTRKHWEDVEAIVIPWFEVTDSDFHYDATITKIPEGAFSVSSVSPRIDKTITDAAGNDIDCKDASFDTEDLDVVDKPGGRQRAAVHEAGHMLGFGDEYISASRPKGTKVGHSALAKKYLGYNVRAKTSDSIMAGGEKVRKHHSVTFREALEKTTGLTEWTLKKPKNIPKPPQELIDTNTYVPETSESVA